jgi:hypothetical protein
MRWITRAMDARTGGLLALGAAIGGFAIAGPAPSPAHAPAPEAGNVAPAGTAYRWSHNRSATSDANRARAGRLNDGDLDADVRLNGSRHEPRSSDKPGKHQRWLNAVADVSIAAARLPPSM